MRLERTKVVRCLAAVSATLAAVTVEGRSANHKLEERQLLVAVGCVVHGIGVGVGRGAARQFPRLKETWNQLAFPRDRRMKKLND